MYRLRLTLALSMLAVVLAQVGTSNAAAPTELFFSEYIEGSSNNKALEIFNGTGTPVNLATGAYDVQMFFNGSGTAGLTIPLTGTVAAGDVYVLAQATASAPILAQADQTNGSGWFNGDDAVVLRKGATGLVVDSIGQVALDPGTEWGTGLTSTADNTLRRKPSISAGDTTTSDGFDPAFEWDGFATDTFDGLGAHSVSSDAAPTVELDRACERSHGGRSRRERLDHLQRARRCHGCVVRHQLHVERWTHGDGVRRSDGLHAGSGRRLRERRDVHGDGPCVAGDGSGRRRPAERDGRELRVQPHDRPPGDADPRDPGCGAHLSEERSDREDPGDRDRASADIGRGLLHPGPEPGLERRDLRGPLRLHGERTDGLCRRCRGDRRHGRRVPPGRGDLGQPDDDAARGAVDLGRVVGERAARDDRGGHRWPNSAGDGDRG